MEASASCQKLTGALPLPACPPCSKRARGWRRGHPLRTRRWSMGENKAARHVGGASIALEPSRALLGQSVSRLLYLWVWGCWSCLREGSGWF